MIELRGLTVRVATDRWSGTVVESADLLVPDGKVTALVGAPGSGKSMLVAAIVGALPSAATRSGELLIDQAIVAPVADPLPADVLGHAPQEGVDAFLSTATVGDQMRDREQQHARWSVDRACAEARFPVDKMDLCPHQLSGGEAKRAALAIALIAAPRILIVDAPTASLDGVLKAAVWRMLRSYADRGAAVLAVTNDVQILRTLRVADQVALMSGGRIVATGGSVDSVPWQRLGR